MKSTGRSLRRGSAVPVNVVAAPQDNTQTRQQLLLGVREPLLARIHASPLENALLPFADALLRDNSFHLPNWMVLCLMTVQDLQLASFAYNPTAHLGVPMWLSSISPIVLPHLLTYEVYQRFVAIALIVTFMMVGLVSICSGYVYQQRKMPHLLFRLLRIIFKLVITALEVPLFQLLFQSLNCKSSTQAPVWRMRNYPTIDCAGHSHLSLYILSILSLVICIPIIFLAAWLIHADSPVSVRCDSRPNGRLQAYIILSQITIVAANTFDNTNASLVSIIITCILLYYLSWYVIVRQPFYNHKVNMLRGANLLGAAVANTVAAVATDPLQDPSTAFTVLITLHLLGIIVGVFAVHAYRQWQQTRILCRLYEVQHKSSARETQNAAEVLTLVPDDLSQTLVTDILREIEVCDRVPPKVFRHGEDAEVGTLKLICPSLPIPPLKFINTIIDPSKAIRFLKSQDNIESKHILATELIHVALKEHPDDARTIWALTRYAEILTGRDIEQKLSSVLSPPSASSLLKRLLEMKRLPVEVKLHAYMYAQELNAKLKQNETDGDRMVSLLEDEEHQMLQAKAALCHVQALQVIRHIWETIRRKQQNPRDVASRSLTQLSRYRRQADAWYRQLTEDFPHSANALRMYALFLSTVAAESMRAKEILLYVDTTEQEDDIRNGVVMPNKSANYGGDGEDYDTDNQQLDRLGIHNKPLSLVPEVRSFPLLSGLTEKSELDDFSNRTGKSKSVSIVSSYSPAAQAPEPVIESISNSIADSDYVGGFITRQEQTAQNAMSVGSGSDATKEERLRETQRQLIALRLQRPLRIRHRLKIYGVSMAAMLIGGYIACVQFLSTSTLLLQDIQMAIRTRKLGIGMMYNIQEMLTAGKLNDTDKFAQAKQLMLANSNNMSNVIAAYLSDDISNPARVYFEAVRQTLDTRVTRFDPVALNPYELANQLLKSVYYAASQPFVAFQTNVVSNNVDIRFILDNSETIADALTVVADSGNVDYQLSSSRQSAIVAGVMVATILLLIAAHFLVIQPVISQSVKERSRALDVLCRTPNVAATDMVTNLDEEIESISEVLAASATSGNMDTKTSQTASTMVKISGIGRSGAAVERRLYGPWWVTVLTTVAFAGLMFGYTMKSAGSTYLTNIIEDSSQRRFQVQYTLFLANGILSNDTQTWRNGYAEYLFDKHITKLSALHEKIVTDKTGLSYIMPNATVIGNICFVKNTTRCTARPYDPATGFTQMATMMPLNHLITQYVTASQQFLYSVDQQGNRNFANLAFRFINSMSEDIIDGLRNIELTLYDTVSNIFDTALRYAQVFFGLSIATLLVTHVILRRLILLPLQQEAEQTAALVLSVPESVIKECTPLRTFIESGGLLDG